MPRVLKDIKINEVSSVDRGAGRGVRVMLIKRDEPTNPSQTENIEMDPEKLGALIAKSVTEAMGTVTKTINDTIAAELAKRDREITLLKMTPAHKAYMDGCDSEDTKKKFGAMSDSERDDFMSKNPRKRAAEPANQDDLAKRDEALNKANTQIVDLAKRLAERDARDATEDFKKRAVAAGLTEDDGDLMRKAFGGDPAAALKFEARLTETRKALQEQVKTGDLFKTFGHVTHVSTKAYDRLMDKAHELRKSKPELSVAQAFTKIYDDPANAALVTEHNQDEMRKRQPAA